jgi:hypothetical protein
VKKRNGNSPVLKSYKNHNSIKSYKNHNSFRQKKSESSLPFYICTGNFTFLTVKMKIKFLFTTYLLQSFESPFKKTNIQRIL